MVIAAIGIVGQVAGAVKSVQEALDALDAARSVILELDNNTGLSLNRIWDHHDHGNYAVTPKSEIPPNSTMVFGSKDTGFMTGTEGRVRFEGDGITLEIYWDNPYVGGNNCDASIWGPNASLYRIVHTCGGGQTDAHMLYELFREDIHLDPSTLADGTLLREEHADATFVIFGGAKFWIPNPDVLEQLYGGADAVVRAVPDGSTAAIPDLPRDGTVLKEQSPDATYLMKNGQKCWIVSPEVLDHYGGPDVVRVVPDGALGAIPDGPPITS